MEARSLAVRTELMFHRAFGEVTDRGDYLVVRYPHSPGYHWGNYLIFPGAPQPGDEDRWPALLRSELCSGDALGHVALSWDTGAADPAVVARFAARGLEFARNRTLTATAVHPPPRPNRDVAIRALAGDAEWERAIRLHAEDYGEFEPLSYREFSRARFSEFRKLAEAGHGAWFGAFIEDRLVGSLGLYHHEGIGRYRNVSTDPEFRRRGICGTMVHAAAAVALKDWNAAQLVIEGDADSEAIRIYESVGFNAAEDSESFCWWERPGGPPPP